MYRLVHVQSQTHENTNIDPKKQSKSVLLYTFCWFNDNYVWYSGIPMYSAVFPIVYLLISPLQTLLKRDNPQCNWGSLKSISQEDREITSYWNSSKNLLFYFVEGCYYYIWFSHPFTHKKWVFPTTTPGGGFPCAKPSLGRTQDGLLPSLWEHVALISNPETFFF